MMNVLWAPWRMEYILSQKEKDCLFCTKPKEEKDRENLILYRDKNAYVIMNKYPYNNGHIMVVPFKHVSTFDGLMDEELLELMKLTKYSVECIKEVYNPEGFNIGINFGEVAGAGIEEHMHIHIVPRWAGDASFMTILGEIRVIPEHILETYDRFYPVFNK